MSMIRHFKRAGVRAANALGLDVVRLSKTPKHSLLGLKRRPIATVIDCGANEGQFAALILREFPKAHIFCFEPLEEPFLELQGWASRHPGRVTCIQSALGDMEGEIAMLQSVDHTASSSMLASTRSLQESMPAMARTSTVSVPITTLDAAMNPYMQALQPEILLKLDVQGYEDRVLRGAPRLLSLARACIIEVCVDVLYENQARFPELVGILHDSGLEYAGNLEQFYGRDGRVKWLDALFVRPE